MSWLRRIVNVFRRQYDRDLDEEIRHHLAMRTEDRRQSGMTRDEAAAEARRMLGNELHLKEATREMDISQWLETMVNDLRYAARQMRRSPGFTLVAVASLALGIGANTAIFTVFDSLVMRKLPVRDPGGIVMLSDPGSAGVAVGVNTGERRLLTYSEFEQLRARLTLFDGLFASESSLPSYNGRVNGGQREEVRARLVSGDFFPVLGVSPAAGRFFGPEDDRAPGAGPYAVLSFDYWQRRFGESPAALGATVTIGKAALTVIGVAGPGFSGETVGERPDLWVPMTMEMSVKPGTDWLHEDLGKNLDKVEWLHLFGRLKPGVSLARAQAEADVVFRNIIESGYNGLLKEETRKEFLDQHVKLRFAPAGASSVRRQAREPLIILLAVVGLVLLIACANLANLLTARMAVRVREIGVRIALGAGRARLIRQMLTECVALAALGSLAGLLVARAGVRLMIGLMSDPTEPLALATAFDARVLLFTAAAGALTALLFGVAPAIRAASLDVNSSIQTASRGGSLGVARASFTKTLVAIQVALSLLLLVGSGLFLRTLRNLEKVELGYPKDELFQVRVDAEAGGYQGPAPIRLYEDLAAALRSIPGVRGVSYSENGLFNGTESGDEIFVEGYTRTGRDDKSSRFDVIGPGYFANLKVPLLLGREFDDQDIAGNRKVAVINQAFATKFFGGRSPIGRHITAQFGDNRWTWEVIGVAADVRDHRLRGEIPPRYYRTPNGGGYIPPQVSFQVRTAGPAAGMAATVRRAIQGRDESLPVLNAEPVSAFVDRWMSGERTIARLSATFGGIALALACIGIYGVLSFGVARRTSEIGLRMALGARRASVIGMILGETGRMVAIGLGLGLLAAAGATRLIASQLYGVAPLDPFTIAMAAAVLIAVAVAAGALPAWRASRVDPVTALRTE
jgi:predicted permease